MVNTGGKWPWPRNVGLLGTHADEVRALRTRLEKNPDASPMPELGPSRLLSPNRSSDNLRIGEPAEANRATAEAAGFTLTHVVFRRFLSQARRRSAVLFDEAVEDAPLEGLPAGRREQMRSMLAREQAMLELLDRYNGLAEDVYMRLLAGAKG